MPDLKEILLSKEVVVPENFSVFKDIFKHFRGRQVQGIAGDKRPLLEKSEDFYLNPPQEGFLQGDILKNLSPVWLAKDETTGNLTAFESDPSLAMVLSTECDSEKRTKDSQTYIRVCPIYEESALLNEIDPKTEQYKTTIGNIRANNYAEYFWMPHVKNTQANLVADLSHIYSVVLEDLHQQVENKKIERIVSLSEDAYFLLLIKLAWFFLRPTTPDSKRKTLQK